MDNLKPNQNLDIHYVNINILKPADYNPRKWTDEATKQITESITRFGLVDPFIVNSAENRKNIVIGGHFRLKVAKDFRFAGIGVDLAISEKDSADCTAMVSAYVFGYQDEFRAYILPHPVNKRLSFPIAIETAVNLSKTVVHGERTQLYIEDVGYQKAFIQHLASKNVPVEGVPVKGQDKRTRLTLVTHLIKEGKVWFPREGVEELIIQLTGFGTEKHDDLADAFSLLMLKVLEKDSEPEPRIMVISMGGPTSGLMREYDHLGPLTADMKF